MENTKPTIGQNIARFRKKAGLTQEELSVKMNVTAQAVSKWENDQSYPDLESVRRLAAVLGVSADAILNGEESLPPVKLVKEGDPARRVLLISVETKDEDDPVTVKLRLPVEMILKASADGSLAKLVGEEAARHLTMCIEAVAGGAVGPIVDVKSEDADTLIEVVDYDD